MKKKLNNSKLIGHVKTKIEWVHTILLVYKELMIDMQQSDILKYSTKMWRNYLWKIPTYLEIKQHILSNNGQDCVLKIKARCWWLVSISPFWGWDQEHRGSRQAQAKR
jgi:hypothetical protein